MKINVKFRVTLLCTLLTAAIAALALNLLLMGENRIQQNYYMNMLRSTAELARDDVLYADGDLEIDRNLDDLPGVRVSLFNTDGDLIYGRRWLELDFKADEMRRAENWFVYDTLLTFEEGESLWLRCICSANAADGILSGRERLAMMLIPALILLAGLGGYIVARRAFRPVARITRTAEGIADGADLKKRIALSGPKDELYDLAHTFDAMFERLDSAFERERQFTSDVSHELRTPVTSILTQSEFALSESAADADRQEALAEIHKKAGSMADLIRRLLTLARMDAGQLPISPEPVDLSLLGEVAAETVAEAAEAKNITLDASGCAPAEITGDHAMLMQAALNLAENAVRYGREGGTVRIETAQTGTEARLTVADDGPGISEADLPHLFERFYQADSARSGEGCGLGLSLADRIMRLHGGRIEVQSAVGEGSRFTLILPRKDGME